MRLEGGESGRDLFQGQRGSEGIAITGREGLGAWERRWGPVLGREVEEGREVAMEIIEGDGRGGVGARAEGLPKTVGIRAGELK